jgi:solute:Na+ symporter, SSS family
LLASIIAVAMSNASGSLNSLAASSVLDFSALGLGRRGGRKLANDADFLRLSRHMTLFWGLVLMGFGLMTWGPVLEAGLTVASLPFGSLLGLFLLGTLNRRSYANGALAGMFAGLITILCVWRLTNIAFTWYVLIGSVTTFLVGSLVSLLTRAHDSENHRANLDAT